MISACEMLGRGVLLLEKHGRVAEEEVYEYDSVNAICDSIPKYHVSSPKPLKFK